MSVAGDGKDASESGGLPHGASSRARHRVPPTASVPVLPEPFTPAKPTIPAIPHQRRPDGPTAVATASIPAVLAADPDAFIEAPETEHLEFIVSLPGVTNDPDLAPSSDATAASPDAAEPEPEPEPEPEEPEEPEEVETVEGELLPAHTVPADDSPTLADYEPPALAIVTEEDPEDADDYRGSRRRVAPWRRYPVGAVAVAVLILLITGAVVFQWASGGDSGGSRNNGLPPRVPGVSMPGAPEPAVGAADPSAEEPPSAATTPAPSSSRSRAGSPAASHSASAPPESVPASSSPAPPPIVQPTSGRMVGKQSQKCIEFRSSQRNAVVLDNCEFRAGNQRWRVQGDLNTGAFLVAENGLCLDVQNAGTGNGNAVWVFSCNGTPAQKWVRHENNTWENTNSHRCLDAANAGTGVGTPLIIWDCKGSDNQIWTLG
ncbi:ricin-type beta-trefoil lectin domain protein [Dactylosporangium sp. NPDC048998]|uniref:RICIN domain-containing protein n=1 Tax=Dactylosporangium sp. NPDC048998 TaxID=3363976 RepID=UPI00372494DB